MRIEQPLDASQGQAVLPHRVAASPPADAGRRIQAIGQPAAIDDSSKLTTAPPEDAVFLDLSPEGREAARKALEALQNKALVALQDDVPGQAQSPGSPAGESTEELKVQERKAEQKSLADLSARDQQVRAHEQSVRALAGNRVVRTASYSYKVGPDGRLYVVDGEINFDTTAIPGDPEATLRKAQQLQRAALAPGDAGQDRLAAAAAAALAAHARMELQKQQNRNEA